MQNLGARWADGKRRFSMVEDVEGERIEDYIQGSPGKRSMDGLQDLRAHFLGIMTCFTLLCPYIYQVSFLVLTGVPNRMVSDEIMKVI
jgi:hypothetical protein